ncbi:MAG: exosortase H [Myxococcota bacterium]|nr:exosortase H [Myxococcota bacterium]
MLVEHAVPRDDAVLADALDALGDEPHVVAVEALEVVGDARRLPLDVYQRTPIWIAPKRDAAVTPEDRTGFWYRTPGLRIRRALTELAFEIGTFFVVNYRRHGRAVKRAERTQARYIRGAVDESKPFLRSSIPAPMPLTPAPTTTVSVSSPGAAPGAGAGAGAFMPPEGRAGPVRPASAAGRGILPAPGDGSQNRCQPGHFGEPASQMQTSQDDSSRPPPERTSGPLAEAPEGEGGTPGGLRAFWAVPTYRFAVNFLAYLTVLGFSYPWLRREFGQLLNAGEHATARLLFEILSFFGANTQLSTERPTVFLSGFPVTIIEECTGLYEALLLGAALLAYPTSWSRKAVGFAIGYPLIYALNLTRILMLLAVGRWYPAAFDFLHLYFWQVTMILMVVFVLYMWVRWVVGSRPAEAT